MKFTQRPPSICTVVAPRTLKYSNLIAHIRRKDFGDLLRFGHSTTSRRSININIEEALGIRRDLLYAHRYRQIEIQLMIGASSILRTEAKFHMSHLHKFGPIAYGN